MDDYTTTGEICQPRGLLLHDIEHIRSREEKCEAGIRKGATTYFGRAEMGQPSKIEVQ